MRPIRCLTPGQAKRCDQEKQGSTRGPRVASGGSPDAGLFVFGEPPKTALELRASPIAAEAFSRFTENDAHPVFLGE